MSRNTESKQMEIDAMLERWNKRKMQKVDIDPYRYDYPEYNPKHDKSK